MDPQQSINRVRENMMARLQDAAASQPVGSRGGRRGDEERRSRDGDPVAQNEKGVPGDDEGGRNRNETGTGDDDDGGGGFPRVGDAAAGEAAEDDEWVEEAVEHPAPDYGVDSPVIR